MTASNIKSQKILAVACFNYDRIMTDSQKSKNNLFSDQEILDLIPTEYYNGHEFFDASHYELKRLPKLSNSKMIIQRYQELKQQHYIVSKKVLLLVLQKQLKCAEEFGRIEMIQRDLSNIIAICKLCRKDLNLAMHQFSSSSFRILNYFRKRKILAGLLNTLYSVKTIYRTKDRLKQLIIEENYPEVIYLISECQKIAEIYEKYKCVVALYSNLNDILEQVEENLDLSISRVCTNFNVESYASIQIAYSFLGKTQISMDQLHMHFIAAVHNTALTSVLKYAESDKNNQYNCVCQSISQDNFLFCLIDLCRSLLVILKSYYLIIKWHENQLTTKFIENKQHKKLFTHVNQQGIIQKLENGISKIYRDVEKKIVIYLDGFDLIPLKFEEFIQALNVIDRISKIGTQICKKNEAKLYDFIKEKFINFIAIYHASRLDELRIFLENEGWNLCPIKSTFNITQLHEFKTFQRILNLSESSSNTYENLCTNVIYEQNNWNQDSFDDFLFPFNIILNESVEEDILQNSEDNQLKGFSEDSDDDEIPEELKYDYVDEINKKSIVKAERRHTGPFITNTTLNILRICGKYLQITRLFKEATKIVIQFMIQVFELYLYTIHSFFTSDLQINSDSIIIYTTNLKRTLSRIKDTLILDNSGGKCDITNQKVYQPRLSSAIDLNNSSKLYSLAERIVAVESLIFLGQQYESFRFYITSVIFHDRDQTCINQFFLQTVSSTVALRKPIYMSAISKAFDTSNVLILMNKVHWELKDVISQHSDYIDFLIEEIKIFKSKLTDIQNCVPLTKEVCITIWECVAHLIAYTLVEGFSNAKKCSNGGRALMQLDLTQLISKFESLTCIRPMPHQEYVASYIKAYYLPESAVELWIKTHSEYSSKHLIGLMSCMYQSKKVKQRFITLIDDLRSTR